MKAPKSSDFGILFKFTHKMRYKVEWQETFGWFWVQMFGSCGSAGRFKQQHHRDALLLEPRPINSLWMSHRDEWFQWRRDFLGFKHFLVTRSFCMKTRLCFSLIWGLPNTPGAVSVLLSRCRMQCVQGSRFLWNEKDKVSKLPSNQNRLNEWQKKWAKEWRCICTSWLGYLLLYCLFHLSHIITRKDKKMLSSFSPVPVFGHRASKQSKQASKRTQWIDPHQTCFIPIKISTSTSGGYWIYDFEQWTQRFVLSG